MKKSILIFVGLMTVYAGIALTDSEYRGLMSSPAVYANKVYDAKGEVLQLVTEEELMLYRVEIDGSRIIMVMGKKGIMPYYLEGDYVSFIRLVFFNTTTYSTVLGASKTVPLFLYVPGGSSAYRY